MSKVTPELIARMQADRDANNHPRNPKDISKKYGVSNFSFYKYTHGNGHRKPIASASTGRLTRIADGADGVVVSLSRLPAPASVNGDSVATPFDPVCGINGCLKKFKNLGGKKIHQSTMHGIHGKNYGRDKHYKLAKHQRNGELQNVNSNSGSFSIESASPEENYHLSRAFGRVQGYLQDYAGSLNLPPATFAYRVGELLQSEARGCGVGSAVRVPSVRAKAARGA